MTYVTVDPVRSLVRLQNEMSRFMRDAFDSESASGGAFVPPVDIVEQGEEIVLLADLPGLRIEDIDVSVENRTLTLTGERKPVADLQNATLFRAERPLGRFTRTFALPATVNVTGITAEFKDGILFVRLPKAAEARARRIEIKQA